jgi:hypothetical protein
VIEDHLGDWRKDHPGISEFSGFVSLLRKVERVHYKYVILVFDTDEVAKAGEDSVIPSGEMNGEFSIRT